jgi:hypothetical protein
MNKNRFANLIIIAGLILTSFSSLQPISMANADTSASTYTVLAPLPCIQGNGVDSCKTGANGDLQNNVDFQTYIQYTFNLLIALSAVAAVAMIVWGGIEYMVSGSFQGKKDGLERVKNAIYGLILVLCSFIILRTVDPRLVDIPTTLVPSINLKDDLAKDATSELMAQIEKEAATYNINKQAAQEALSQTNKQKTEQQAKIDAIQAKIDALGPNPNVNDPEYKKLLADKTNAQNEYRQLDINYTKTKAVGKINGLLENSLLQFQSSTISAKEKLKKITENETLLSKTRDQATSDLGTVGWSDIKDVNDQGNNAEAVMILTKVDIVVKDVIVGDSGRVFPQNFDGSGDPLFGSKTADAKNTIKVEISKAERLVDTITDPGMKTNLVAKIDQTKKAFEAKFGK